MSEQPPTQDCRPLAGDGTQSLAVLQPAAGQAPAHCLYACLGGDAMQVARRGCDWLRAQLNGAPGGETTCPRGFQVAAQPVTLHGATGVLVSVRGRLDGVGDRVLDELAAARQLATQLEQTVLENEGLAEEVLQNYEQLGVLLDVTHEIAGLTRTEDLERVVFGRLGQLLSADEVVIISSRQTLQRFVTADGQFRVPEELPATSRYHTLLEQAPGTAGVSITPVDDRQVLSFMLSAFEGQHEVVLVERPAGAAEFSAGEVRIAEALLSFAGNIINNSKLHDRIRRMSLEATRALVYAIDKKDRYTSGHSQRVGFMARLTGEALGLPVAELDQLEWSGLLHDIGKIGVPEEILNKPGKLTDAEFDEIKKHPQMGYDILAPIKAFEHILGGVLSHHENEDGTGYPHALQGDEIPLFGRIIHVVDVFDALSSTRSYRQAFTVDRALEIVLSMSGEKMYAPAVQAFEVALNDFRYLQPDAFKAMFYFALDDEAGGLLAGETP